VPNDAKFCTSCGTELGVTTSAALQSAQSTYTPPSPLSDLGSRIVGGIIDFVIVGIIAGILSIFLAVPGAMFRPNMMAPFWSVFLGGIWGVIGVMWLLWLIYFTYFEGTSGQTIGKKFVHIKVVKEDGSRCDVGSALVRNILRIIDYLPFLYILGIILIAATDKKQRLGDMLAKTIVIKA
jgi:uncharacterized RDD family membrane protein YckC